MDVLVVGGGGREHALVWALARSPSVERIYCAPGNAGIAPLAECWDIKADDLQGLVLAAEQHAVDLVVVGPEVPLTLGISELFDQAGIPCFGPDRAAATIEGSKRFAKDFMQRHGIPTARFEVFSETGAARDFVDDSPWGLPLVVKADGLAAGKGVIVAEDALAARAAIDTTMVEQAFGGAGNTIVVEEYLRGTEVTIMALSDGETAIPLLPSQDHKQAYDGDRGPNTGGMGAFAPAYSVLDEAAARQITETVLQPTITGLAAEGRKFNGVLYAGLMLTETGPCVLEFNCRFGDPEAQAIIPLLDEDFGELLGGIAEGNRLERPLRWRAEHCACVVLAAENYPGKYRHGDPIRGLEGLEGRDDVVVFHAGTLREDDQIATSGGRVLGVTATGSSLESALDTAYEAVAKIEFEGMHYRRDIGRRGERL